MPIGVRDEFRSGVLKSLARIFFPLLAQKLSGFARILPDFLPENGYLKNSGGGGGGGGGWLQPPTPMARTPMDQRLYVVYVL